MHHPRGCPDFARATVQPITDTLSHVLALAPNDVWMTGERAVVHWDGAKWRGLVGVALSPALAASGPNDVWIGGVLHWDGSHMVNTKPQPSRPEAMWFASSTDGWAVDGTTTAQHWNGATWTPVATGALVGLTAIQGFATQEVWAVGGPSVRRWNGAAWTSPPTPFPAGQTAKIIAGVAPDDFWVGGSSLYHYQGGQWKQRFPDSVGAIGVGAVNDVEIIRGTASAYHWNGTSLSPAPVDSQICFALGACRGVGIAGGKRFFAGQFSKSVAPVTRGCGAFASDGASAPLCTYGPQVEACRIVDVGGGKPMYRTDKGKVYVGLPGKEQLWGITVDDVAVEVSSKAPNDAWVTGFYEAVNLASHWDGIAWSYAQLPARPTSAVGAASSTSAWVIMGAKTAYWDGAAWSERGELPSGTYAVIDGASATDAWAGGSDGVAHWDGVAWKRMFESPKGVENLRAFRGADIIAVAANAAGTASIYHWNGIAWRELPGSALGGIHNSLGCLKNNNTSIVANNDIWAVRHTQTDPRAAHWNGTTWEMLPTGEVNAFAIGKTIGASAESVYLTTDQLHVMQR